MEQSKGEKGVQMVIPTYLQRVVPRTIQGTVNHLNNHAIDWGWQGFIAYGAQTSVVIVQPSVIQHLQILSKHQFPVVRVKWRNTNHYHTMSASYTLVLASADSSGVIYIWDVARAEVISTLQDGNRPITELKWLGGQDGSEYLLAALHPSYSLVLWDTRHGTKVWKKSYTESLQSFCFDPFSFSNIAFLCQGCILLVEDFSIRKCPSSNGKRFFVSVPLSPARNSFGATEKKTTTIITNKMKQLVSGDVKLKNEEGAHMQDCIQLLFHNTCHDILILIFPKEVLLIDLLIKQTIGFINLDRNMAPITQVVSCWQTDAIFCLHESGSISGYFRRNNAIQDGMSSSEKNPAQSVDVLYEKKCCSEPLRLGRGKEPIAFAIDQVSEKKFVFLLGPADSRLVFKDLIKEISFDHLCNKYSRDQPSKVSLKIKDNHFSPVLQSKVLEIANLTIPELSISHIIPATTSDQVFPTLRVMVTGLLPSVMPASMIRMCPPLTTKNINFYVPLMAKGCQSGEVQIINLATGTVEREFSLHTCAVRGIEWTSLNSFLSFGYQILTNAQGRVRNELIYTHTQTGYKLALRVNKTEESPIEMIRVSYLKQYFIVVLANDPLELWDCNSLSPLRTVSRKSPKITAMEWSVPIGQVRARRNSASPAKEPEMVADSNSSPGTPVTPSLTPLTTDTKESITPEKQPRIKETLVFTSGEGQLFHFSVKGNVFTDGTKVPHSVQRSQVTFIAWKNSKIVLSDVDGNISIWDLKTRAVRTIASHRGHIKKVRFAPGKDNMKLLVLYRDGIDVWDVKDISLLAQLKSPKDCVEIVDIDWAASDNPVVSLVDGTLKVLDSSLKKAHSSVSQYFFKEPVASPYLLPPEASLNLRTLLTHQPWKKDYSLTFSVDDGFTTEQVEKINQWISHVPEEITSFMCDCNSTMHRALVTAYLFGDKGEIDFWWVTTHYMALGLYQDCRFTSKTDNPEMQFDALPHSTIALPLSYYHLCDNKSYQREELQRLYIHESKDLPRSLKDQLGRKLAVIGEKDRVVRMLLDADPNNQQLYTDSLRACMLSATEHSTQAQSTIKLVATNLIAAGSIVEGIELLSMIGKNADACRYLQSHGHWDDAIWLVKCIISPSEASDLVKRWAHHLDSSGHKDKAVLAYMSGGLTSSAIENLVQQHYHQRAALMLQVIQELDLREETRSTNVTPEVISVSHSLTVNTYRKYALFLLGLGNTAACEHFCLMLGEAGQELWNQLMSSVF